MWSAIPRRIAVIGSSCSPGAAATARRCRRRLRGRFGRGCGSRLRRRSRSWSGLGGSGRGGSGRFCRAEPRRHPTRRTGGCPSSSLVPPMWTLDTSTLCSAMMRATTGDSSSNPARRSSAPTAAVREPVREWPRRRSCCLGARRPEPRRGLSGRRLGRSLGLRSRRASTTADDRASFVPTSTVSPSWTRIWVDPLAGLGTSVSTLSVEISSSDSSASICSPSCLSHFVIVPSETETPIWGITTSTASVVATLRVQVTVTKDAGESSHKA